MTLLETKIQRARELIRTSKHIALATTNADGSPHNSPVRFFYDTTLEHIFWGSATEAQHSQNIVHTGQVFAVLYDRIETGGVFMQCNEGRILEESELEAALDIVNNERIKDGQQPVSLDYYTSGGPQKMWSARIVNIWINMPVRDERGFILRDERVELERNMLW